MKQASAKHRRSSPTNVFVSLFDKQFPQSSIDKSTSSERYSSSKAKKSKGECDPMAAFQDLPIGAEYLIRQIAAEKIMEELLDKINNRENVQHRVISSIVKEFPATCHRTYSIVWEDGSQREMLPLWIIVCLCPPLETVIAVYEANPQAIFVEEPCKNSLSLHLASAFEASLDVVQFIYSKNKTAIRKPRKDGVLPIHLAAGYYLGNPSVLNFLISQYPEGAKNVCLGIRWSPMHSASHGGVSDVEVLQRLHEIDESMIHSRDKHGRLPIHLACLSKKGNPSLIEFLMKLAPQTATIEDNHFGRTPIHLLCINQDPETIRVMLDLIPNPNDARNTYGGATILAWAAMKNSPASVNYLARRFPHMLSIPTLDETQYTPLYCAIYNDAPLETLRILIDQYPQALFTLDGSGRRPLRAARSSGVGKEIIQLLEASERKYRNKVGGWFCFY